MIQALLVDLDDTLYEYAPSEAAGRARLGRLFSERLGVPEEAFELAYARARDDVKSRCSTPSGHARLLYVHELLHSLARGEDRLPRLALCRELERAYWDAYLANASPRDRARELLSSFRGRGGKIAIVTDLTLDVQLRKLEALDLFGVLDALVASEEVGEDKPSPAPFVLAARRLGVPLEACAVIGDSDAKDGAGARALGLPFFHVRTDASGTGMGLGDIEEDIYRRNGWKR